MHFTGSTTFTSPSGVEKELRRTIPVQAAALLAGGSAGCWRLFSSHQGTKPPRKADAIKHLHDHTDSALTYKPGLKVYLPLLPWWLVAGTANERITLSEKRRHSAVGCLRNASAAGCVPPSAPTAWWKCGSAAHSCAIATPASNAVPVRATARLPRWRYRPASAVPAPSSTAGSPVKRPPAIVAGVAEAETGKIFRSHLQPAQYHLYFHLLRRWIEPHA